MSIAELIEAVEAGDDAAFRKANRAAFSTPCQDMAMQLREENCRHAYKGSLDAAKALHEALLPGIMWARSPNGQFCLFDRNAEEVSYSFEKDRNHARAWLLAILRAKEASQ